MTITITDPRVEALIWERLQSGAFEDAEDVLRHALQLSAQTIPPVTPRRKSLREVFEAAQGLGHHVDFSGNPSFARLVDLS